MAQTRFGQVPPQNQTSIEIDDKPVVQCPLVEDCILVQISFS